MRQLYLFTIVFLASYGPSAQSVTPLTTVHNERGGSNQMYRYFVQGDRLLALGSQTLDNPDFGAVMEVDTTTGVLTPLLADDLFKDSYSVVDPFVPVADHLFLRLGTDRYEVDLFVVRENEVVRLTNNNDGYVSDPILHGDSILFLAAGTPVNATDNVYHLGLNHRMELWTTDGTLDGTVKVRDLPFMESRFSYNELELLSYEDRLIVRKTGSSFGNIIYEEARGSELVPLVVGNPELRNDFQYRREFTTRFGDAFYFLGKPFPFNGVTNGLFRFVPDSNDLRIVLPDVYPTDDPSIGKWYQSWINTEDYLFTVIQPVGKPGLKVYVMDHVRPDFAELIVDDLTKGPIAASWRDGYLYYTASSAENPEVNALYRFEPEQRTHETIVNELRGNAFEIEKGENVMYLLTDGGKTYRYTPETAELETFDNRGHGMSSFFVFPLWGRNAAVWGDDLIYDVGIDSTSAAGRIGDLHILKAEADQPRLLADLGRNNYFGVFNTADHFVGDRLPIRLFTEFSTENVLTYDRSVGDTVRVGFDREVNTNEFYRFGEKTIVSAFDPADGSSVFKLFDGISLSDIHVALPDGGEIPYLSNDSRIGEDYYVTTDRNFFKLRLSGDTLTGDTVLTVPSDGFASIMYCNTELFVVSLSSQEVPRSAHVFNLEGELLYEIPEETEYTLLGAGPNGMWYYEGDPAGQVNQLLFVPGDGGNVVRLSLADVTMGEMTERIWPATERMVFAGYTEEFGREFFVADPITGSVSLLKDINPGPEGSLPFFTNSFVNGEVLYFTAEDGTSGYELWRTDATPAGTFQIADINPGPGGSCPDNFVVSDEDVILFTALGPMGRELYRLDLGDSPNAKLIADVNPGFRSGDPRNFVVAEDGLYFIGQPGKDQSSQLFTLPKSLVTSAEDIPVAREFPLVYPNPTREVVRVEAPGGKTIERILLYDVSGRPVWQRVVAAETANVSLANLPAGNYWLATRYATGERAVQAIVKSN